MNRTPAAHRLATKRARAERKRQHAEDRFSRGGHVKPSSLPGVVEGRCLTCGHGHGLHVVGGGYPELPHDTVLEIHSESMSDVMERLREASKWDQRMKGAWT